MTDLSNAKKVQSYDVEAVNSRKHRQEKRERAHAIHPKRVSGTFRTIKWVVMVLALGIYYVTPWIRWDRGPLLPDQAVLIDFTNARFYFFFIELWAHEVYYLTGLLIMAATGLFLATTLFGRIWCGFACPQTVWTDLFVWVERFIEGDRSARIRLDQAPLSVEKLTKRATKNIIWLAIAVATGGAWIFYFRDAPTLLGELVTFNASLTSYLTMGFLTATTFILGGYMREKVCTFWCPWPRIQGAMLDDESLVVTYREARGEPRGPVRKHANDISETPKGDCIDCKACVVVCPMGIDIRDGMQLECIGCGLCIDACDDIMTKVQKPKGLIAYDSERNTQNAVRGETRFSFRWFRARSVMYATIWAAVGMIMVVSLTIRPNFDITALHDRSPLFVTLSDGSVRNAYDIKIMNKYREDREFVLSVSGLGVSSITRPETDLVSETSDVIRLIAPATSQSSFRVFISATQAGAITQAIRDNIEIELVLTDVTSGEQRRADGFFYGPW